MDMDNAIMYYFENVIKPSVQENGESIKVPTMYGLLKGGIILGLKDS